LIVPLVCFSGFYQKLSVSSFEVINFKKINNLIIFLNFFIKKRPLVWEEVL